MAKISIDYGSKNYPWLRREVGNQVLIAVSAAIEKLGELGYLIEVVMIRTHPTQNFPFVEIKLVFVDPEPFPGDTSKFDREFTVKCLDIDIDQVVERETIAAVESAIGYRMDLLSRRENRLRHMLGKFIEANPQQSPQ